MTFVLQHDPARIYYVCVIELGKSAESGKQSTSVHSFKKTNTPSNPWEAQQLTQICINDSLGKMNDLVVIIYAIGNIYIDS